MPTTILIKRGAESNRTSIVPQLGEILVTSDQHKLFIGDGATSGGLSITSSQAETSSFYRVSTPTGQAYFGATATSSVAGVVETDRVEDAVNKIELILEKLAPAKPPGLSTKTLTLVSAYTALSASSNTSFSTVRNSTSPVFQLTGGTGAANAFGDGDAGSLTGSIDGASVGSTAIAASPTSNVGTFGQLQITLNDDFYVGQPGKAGFWRGLVAQINATGVNSTGPHSASLNHSTTGKTSDLIFFIDDPVTPTLVTGSAIGSGATYISGVPGLVGGVSSSAIAFTVTGSNTVSRFFNSTRIFSVGGTGITTSNFTLPTAPLSGSIQSGSRSVNVNAASANENPSFTFTAYNSIATTATNVISNTRLRMDSTLDTANRTPSGQNQFPTTGYGSAWDSSQDLSVAGQEEMQMLNAQYQYPTGNYTGSLPVAGPNYSSLPAVTFSTIRWVTFSLGAQTNIQNILVTFANTTSFGSSALMPAGTPNGTFYLYAKVEGATGWVDGNAAFPGAGSPVSDGDAALVVADSTGTLKKVTFGSTVRTGNVYIRVGFASGQAYKFGSISATYS